MFTQIEPQKPRPALEFPFVFADPQELQGAMHHGKPRSTTVSFARTLVQYLIRYLSDYSRKSLNDISLLGCLFPNTTETQDNLAFVTPFENFADNRNFFRINAVVLVRILLKPPFFENSFPASSFAIVLRHLDCFQASVRLLSRRADRVQYFFFGLDDSGLGAGGAAAGSNKR